MADSGSSSTPKAVFLSYAREDTVVAQRIADALRGFAIEVWFDQSELRGGDAWDQKIRKQIRDCALFIPLVSQATQARGEGYFRLEWKLAVERTHLMAEGHPFLVPVALGGLPESGAIVPPEFLRVQWTRFAGDVPTPTFIDQVYRLLNAPRTGSGTPAPAPARAAPDSPAPAAAKKRTGTMVGSATAIVVAIAVAVSVSRHGSKPAATEPAAATASAPEAAVNDKSIAVLPFANMSEEKDSVYFTDGVQEDILTDLALIHDLRVVSRTSVEQYRDTRKSIREIGQELHVAYILEGSVRREGNQVRVTGQLIKAGSDEHVWAQAYNRSLTDIFSIQSELAQSIANALAAQITNRESDLLQRRPTQNVAAYELYLKARQEVGYGTDGAYQRRLQLLSSAVQLDPNFAQAWGELADDYALMRFNYMAVGADTLDRAKAAIDRAVALAPDNPAVIADLGTYYYYGFRDYQRAAEQYQRLAALTPNDPTLFNSLGLIQRRQGHWHEAIANIRKAVALEPNSAQFLFNLYSSLLAVGDLPGFLEAEHRNAMLHPDNLVGLISWATDIHAYNGSRAEGDAIIAALSPEVAASPAGIAARKNWAYELGDLSEFMRLDRQQRYYDGDSQPHFEQDIVAAVAYRAAGDRATSDARVTDAETALRPLIAGSPENVRYLGYLGHCAALRGNREEARRFYGQAIDAMPISRDALQGAVTASVAAVGLAWCDPDGALDQLEKLERVPNGVVQMGLTPTSLATNPLFYPLRNLPRAQALSARMLTLKL